MKKRYLSLLCVPLFIISCAKDIPFAFYPYSNVNPSFNVKEAYNDDIIYRLNKYQNLEYYPCRSNELKTIESYREIYESDVLNNTHINQSSLDEQHLLVVPIYFSDNADDKSMELRKDKTIYLKNAFFGDPNKTGFESVASFYNKSSYGQLSITGEVTDWFMTSYKSNDDFTDYTKVSKLIIEEAMEWLKSSDFDLSIYDNDKDDYLDGVYFIYDHPFNAEKSESLFWAFTSHINKGEYSLNNVAPYLCSYSWSSVEFAIQEENLAYHNTYIHEVGHLFGLQDYYSNISSFQPTGSFDMMDSNLGDHTGYSKMLLNWVTPYVLKNEGKVTLRSFSDTGDLLLVPLGSYNDTPYDEYLLLEYFTGEGLNESNGASYAYQSVTGEQNIFSFPTYHGVKVYHVDSRLGYLSKKYLSGVSNSIIAYFDDINVYEKIKDTSYCIGIANTNQSINTSTPKVLYHLLESSGENSFMRRNAASNKTLFRLNDSFGINTFTNFVSNKLDENGNHYSLGYTFKIIELHGDSVTIEFTKK